MYKDIPVFVVRGYFFVVAMVVSVAALIFC